MKKLLLTSLVVVVALFIVAWVGSLLFLGSAVKAGVNAIGPRVTQTKVELQGASLSLLGSGTLTGLSVGNPKGWSDQPAFSLGKIHFDVAPASLLTDTIVVNELVIEQPEFLYETHLVSSNIGDLQKNIEATVGASDKAQPAADKGAKPKKFIVKHFKLQGGKVTVGVGPAALPLPLPPIEGKDLGVAEGGLTGGQLAFALTRQIAPTIVKATTGAAAKLGGTMGAAGADAVKRAGEGLKGLFNGDKK